MRATGSPERRSVVNDNVEAILAGRKANVSVAVPNEPKLQNTRIQKIIVVSEKDYVHLLGEATGETYNIKGRPELEQVTLHVQAVSGKADAELPDSYDPMPDLMILFDTTRCTFVISPNVEDKLLEELSDQLEHRSTEIVVTKSICGFGDHEFNTINPLLHRLWRRFIRVCLLPQMKDEGRMQLMEERICGEIPYTDDVVAEADASDTEEVSKKKRKKKKGKKRGDAPGDSFPTASRKTLDFTPTPTPLLRSTSSRLKPNTSMKKGLLKKSASVKNIVK
jgi:hypothetical protein